MMADAQGTDTGISDAEALMRSVGRRVRELRRARLFSRRELSEMSGVSQRYLAQLEAGRGNISIALLWRVARALDHDVGDLVAPRRPAETDIAALFRAAGADAQRRVLAILQQPERPDQRAGRVALIGLRGAGKSTLGRMLGQALGCPFVELNREIEKQGGMPIAEIMALYGLEGYRRLEREALSQVTAAGSPVVLAVAGGIVAEPQTYDTLLRYFHTVWLRARPEDHMARVRAQGDERPMAGNPRAMDDLRAILTARETLYSRATAQLDTAGATPEASLNSLQAVLRDLGIPAAELSR